MAHNYSFDQNYDSDDEDNEQKFVYDGKDIGKIFRLFFFKHFVN